MIDDMLKKISNFDNENTILEKKYTNNSFVSYGSKNIDFSVLDKKRFLTEVIYSFVFILLYFLFSLPFIKDFIPLPISLLFGENFFNFGITAFLIICLFFNIGKAFPVGIITFLLLILKIFYKIICFQNVNISSFQEKSTNIKKIIQKNNIEKNFLIKQILNNDDLSYQLVLKKKTSIENKIYKKYFYDKLIHSESNNSQHSLEEKIYLMKKERKNKKISII